METLTGGLAKPVLRISSLMNTLSTGSEYNFPVCIWLHETHPVSRPRCYVCPSASMVINPSCSYLDSSGNISLGALKNWSQVRPIVRAHCPAGAAWRFILIFYKPFYNLQLVHYTRVDLVLWKRKKKRTWRKKMLPTTKTFLKHCARWQTDTKAWRHNRHFLNLICIE